MMQAHSDDSLDENRILCELRNLDQRLNSKSSTQTNPHTVMRSRQEYNSFGKYAQLQECDRVFLNQMNNLEYFSEINSKDPEEDSLFEHEMQFLAHQAIKGQLASSKISAKTTQQSKSIQMNDANRGKVKICETNASKQTNYEQVLREQVYIFKRQKKEQNRTFIKKETTPTVSTKTNKTYPTVSKPNHKKNVKSNEEPSKKESQKYQSNFQNYLCHEQNAKPIADHKNPSIRMKTEGAKKSFQDIESYLSQLVTSHIGSKGEQESRSRSRIREKAQQNDASLECTFKPKILQKSKEMIKSSKNVVERLSTNNLHKLQKSPYQPTKQNAVRPRMQRIEELSQPRKLKAADPSQMEELPSFKPHLSKKSLEHMSNCTYDVATRNKLWLEQKEEKITRMRQEEEEQKFKREECTHSPAIKMYRGEQDVQFSRFGKEGMVQYFERLSMMKKKSSSGNLRKEEGYATKDISEEISNKQNTNCNLTRERSTPTGASGPSKAKKQTYEQAVKSLHSKIMKLKI